MFGSSNSFRQTSSSPFGSPSVFGQTNNANNNPFCSKSPFGANSTGVFGTQTSSQIDSSPVFCASSSPSFGASSTPAFGASSSGFDCKSLFSQIPSVFGSTTPSQPTFGSNLFGSTQFGASSQPSFSTPSTPTFWTSTTPAFGATSAPAFGATSASASGSTSTPAFGSSPFGATSAAAFGATSTSTSTPAFGSSPFGATSASAFGATSASAFRSTSTPAFGSSPFGSTSAAAFGATSASAFGSTSTPAFGSSPFGATSLPFSFWSSPVSGQSRSAFGTATSPFGVQSSPFGGQATTPALGSCGFGQTSFGGQRGGSRVTPYAQTPEADNGCGTHPAVKFVSISAMPEYKDKSHEELRWEDYQQGDKGCPNLIGQTSGGMGFNNTQLKAKSFPLKTSTFTTPGFGATGFAFGSSTFGASSTPASGATSAFGTATSPFGPQSFPFGSQATSPALGGSGFGQTSFGGQCGGSRITSYAQTPKADDGCGTQPAVKFQSISAMAAFKNKSHEELRWEDYQQGDKGCPNLIGETSGGMGFNNTQSNPFTFSPAFTQLKAKPFSPKTSTYTTPGFGATSAFGSSPFATATSAFRAQSLPFGIPNPAAQTYGGMGFNNTQSNPFSSSPSLGQTSSRFGQTGLPFGQSARVFRKSKRVFGATSSRASSVFGQSTSAFGSNLCDTAMSPFGAQSSPFGYPATKPAFGSCGFGQTSFGGQRGGSRVTPYAQTPEADSGSGTQPAGKLESISAMPAYKDKSHEELRWEDYQQGDKGGPNPIGQTSGGMGFNTTQSNPFNFPPAFTQSPGQASSLFGQTAPSFGQRIPAFGQSHAFGGNLSSSTPTFNQTTPFISMPFQLAQPTQNSSGFGFGTPAGGIGGTLSVFSQNNLVCFFACLSIKEP